MAVIKSNQEIAKDVFRMTVSGVSLGRAGQFYLLRVPGVEVLNVGTTSKTMPDFPSMWERMVSGR